MYNLRELKQLYTIQCKLRLTQLQREYLKVRYEIRGKQRIHGKSLLTKLTITRKEKQKIWNSVGKEIR